MLETKEEVKRDRTRDMLITLEPGMKESLQRIAALRRTSVRGSTVWLLAHAIEWYEGLSREQRASA